MAKQMKVTPLCECRWAHVHKARKGFNDGDRPKFEIELVFDQSNQEMWAWAGELNGRIKSMLLPICPIKPDRDKKTKKPTGKYFVKFHTGEQYPPKVFDNDGTVIGPDTAIGNGSKVQVSYTESKFDGFGGGVTLYLSNVCVRELVEYTAQGGSEFGFDGATTEPAPYNEFGHHTVTGPVNEPMAQAIEESGLDLGGPEDVFDQAIMPSLATVNYLQEQILGKDENDSSLPF